MAASVLAMVVAYWALLYFMQDSMVFPRHMAPRPGPADRLPGALDWRKPVQGTPGGEVQAAFFPPLPSPGRDAQSTQSTRATAPSSPAPLLVYFHGNAEIIHQHADTARIYQRMGFAVLLIEYRGYGLSAGHPSQAGIGDDAEHFLNLALARPDVDPGRLAYHGRSLGGALAAELARRRPPRAMVLESAFSSLTSMALRRLAPPFLVRNPFRTDLVLANADWPVLIMHGSDDDIIPLAEAHRLRDVALSRGLPLSYHEYPCAHNDMPGEGNEPDFWSRIEAFLKQFVLQAKP